MVTGGPLILTETEELPFPTIEERARYRSRLGDASAHADALRSIPAFHQVEVGGSATGGSAGSGVLRVAAWNAERGRHPEAAARLVAESGADVALLSEMDHGMARTGQRHTTADLAERLGCSYVFGVEFVELGRGSEVDRRRDPESAGPDEDNARGLHGNAVLSRCRSERPGLVRLSDDPAWFGEERGEPRIGGRVAVVATMAFDGGELAVASVHLESSSTPEERAAEFRVLLDALDEYAGDRPVVIGGDLNTCSAAASDLMRPGMWDRLLEDDLDRFVEPVAYEPLFRDAASRGYQWERANRPGPTTRFPRDSRLWDYALRLDWILTRGVECVDPQTVPAVAAGDLDAPISDHDLLAVTVRRASRSV